MKCYTKFSLSEHCNKMCCGDKTRDLRAILPQTGTLRSGLLDIVTLQTFTRELPLLDKCVSVVFKPFLCPLVPYEGSSWVGGMGVKSESLNITETE